MKNKLHAPYCIIANLKKQFLAHGNSEGHKVINLGSLDWASIQKGISTLYNASLLVNEHPQKSFTLYEDAPLLTKRRCIVWLVEYTC